MVQRNYSSEIFIASIDVDGVDLPFLDDANQRIDRENSFKDFLDCFKLLTISSSPFPLAIINGVGEGQGIISNVFTNLDKYIDIPEDPREFMDVFHSYRCGIGPDGKGAVYDNSNLPIKGILDLTYKGEHVYNKDSGLWEDKGGVSLIEEGLNMLIENKNYTKRHYINSIRDIVVDKDTVVQEDKFAPYIEKWCK